MTNTPPKGLIQPQISTQYFDLERRPPSNELRPWVEYYWVIRWDLTGQPAYTQSNLPHAAHHMVINPFGQSGVVGIHTKRFEYTLRGAGQLLGVRFKTATFGCFYPHKLSALNDTYTPVESIFKLDNALCDTDLLTQWVAQNEIDKAVIGIERIVSSATKQVPEGAKLAAAMVKRIEGDFSLCQVQQLAAIYRMSERSVQRLFDQYIGVSPKWVIHRYRIFEALAQLDSNASLSLSQLAVSLGYHDQAHFSRVFKKMVGLTPKAYLAGIT